MRIVTIIDGYGAGQHLPKAFAKHGVACAHIKTTPRLDPLYRGRFDAAAYVTAMDGSGDVAEMEGRLRTWAGRHGHEIEAVIPGMEPGVELADALAARLQLPTGNGTALSGARRDKFQMHDVLRRFGLRSILQYKAAELPPILEWVRQHHRWPVIVKPLDSAGIDGVTLCHTEKEVEAAFRAVRGHVNLMGSLNEEVLVQEFVGGLEYVVNSVSRGGRHEVVEIWRSAKKYIDGIGIVYDREELLPYRGTPQDELVAYMGRVLDALGIENGPTHAELKYQSEPVLIEVAARISGLQNPRVSDAALGLNQVDLTADAYVDAERFDRVTRHPRVLRRRCWMVVLPTRQAGIIESMPFIDEIRHLPTYFDAAYRVRPGQRIEPTTNLNSCIGVVNLVAKDEGAIERDHRRILEMVPNGCVMQQ